MSKYGVFSGPYFPIFGMNTEIYGETGKDGPEKTPHLDIFLRSEQTNFGVLQTRLLISIA